MQNQRSIKNIVVSLNDKRFVRLYIPEADKTYLKEFKTLPEALGKRKVTGSSVNDLGIWRFNSTETQKVSNVKPLEKKVYKRDDGL